MLFNEGSFIKVDQTRCLNYQHNDVGCNHCVSHCPGGSLSLINNTILLEGDKCLGCGLCFSDCPTEAFTAKQWDETTIFAEVEKQASSETQFFCEYNDNPFLGREEKDKGAIQIPTCLSSISKGAWFEVGLMTSVELRLEKCFECPMKQTLKRLKLATETAAEWISASGHTSAFSYIYNVEAVQKWRKQKAVSTGLKVTSRRDLFLSLFNQSKDIVQQIREKDFSLKGNKKREGRDSLLPQWQKRLENSFISSFKEGGSPAYWPSIHKNTNCVNCGMCSSNCPTQALQIKIEGNRAIHVFTSGYCLDCRICMLFCPTESISRDRSLNTHPFEAQTVLEGLVFECERCGNQTFSNEQNLCYWCQNEPEDTDLLSDVWNHFV